ncbi:hypothetical protein MNEG_5315 [Monoraphidium neglectum]|uniref:Uncharacterized protein n=1 Tax=Monoraphidium neglectum TaxID=145388 RepID=A0A0D2NAY7_9CHLO|nr:hypothetical protein MNEG_5315 [Monoraphidium neglectum]KIZ02646.1 hypothetical protein MNEG_5315 [Monoraphidium neglectum]|eukprot:XP_013901665.1 hypothetical protein MNEG_5315 [Monoraphidium neglectum]
MNVTIPRLAAAADMQATYRDLRTRDYHEADKSLAQALGLPDYLSNAHSAATLDFTASVLEFCGEQGVTGDQAATLLVIGEQLLRSCAAGTPRAEAQAVLRAELLSRCTPGPAAASGALAPDLVASAARLFASTLLQHWSLYALVFGRPQQHTRHSESLLVEAPMAATPLEMALPEDEWREKLAADASHREEAARAAAAAEAASREAAAEAEAERRRGEEAAARQEQLSKKPQTLEEAVEQLVVRRVDEERSALERELQDRQQALAARLAQLEGAAAAGSAAAGAVPAGARVLSTASGANGAKKQ